MCACAEVDLRILKERRMSARRRKTGQSCNPGHEVRNESNNHCININKIY